MCEYCGPSDPRPRTPEEEDGHRAQMDRLVANLHTSLARRGTTVDEVLDSDCYKPRHRALGTWFRDTFFNVRVAIGWV